MKFIEKKNDKNDTNDNFVQNPLNPALYGRLCVPLSWYGENPKVCIYSFRI